MRVILFGLTGFGNAALRALRRAGAEVAAVMTRKETGPFPYYPERDLAAEARELGIPVHEDPAINNLEFFDQIKPLAPDLLVVATYHQKIPGRLIKWAKKGGIAVYPALLPAYRGATSTNWAIVFGEKETGVSIVDLTLQADSGDLLSQVRHPIGENDTDGTLRQKLAELSGKMLEGLIRGFHTGTELPRAKQDALKSTYYPPRGKRDALITFDEPTANVHNRIRGMNPFPGAYTLWEGKEIPILESQPDAGESFELRSGLLLGRADGYLRVKTKNGSIRIRTGETVESSNGPVVFSDVHALAAPKLKASDINHTRQEYGIEKGSEEFPAMVVLSVAYPCNAKCPHCPYTEGNSEIRLKYADQPYIDPELFKKIARECGEYNSFLRITGGGEPMLHPNDMVSLIEYAKSVGSRVWMNSNGSRYTPEKIDRLLKAGIDMIEFSVDAAEESVYSIVRAGLDWKELNETMRYMLRRRAELKSPTRIVCSMIMQDRIKDKVEEYVQYWSKEVGVDEVIRRKFLTWGSNTNLDAGHSLDPTPYLEKVEGVPCPYPFHRLNVDTRGKVEVCGFDIAGRTNFGSVRDQTIKEIWRGAQFEWWRQMHAERRGGEIPLCRECPDWQYRSWTHNYTKVLKTAEKHRQESIQTFEHLDR